MSHARTHVVVCLSMLLVSASSGAVEIINAVDRGWYDESGSHTTNNENYGAGDCRGQTCTAGENDFRNFFVFDLSNVPGPVLGATLLLFNPEQGFFSDTGSEEYQVADVITPVGELIGGFGGLDAWEDLGTGEIYGSYLATAADADRIVRIDLNDAALVALSGAEGLFAFGGRITTLNDQADEETLFAFTTNEQVFGTRLLLVTAPDDLGLSIEGLNAYVGFCENVTDPQIGGGPIPRGGNVEVLDCGDLGVTVTDGDQVSAFVRGRMPAGGSAFRGLAIGVEDGALVTCRNSTTGASASGVILDGGWDCVQAGLAFADFDLLTVRVEGTARSPAR